jgi:hypothetical protein
MPEAYEYDVLPEQLRVQVIHIWRDVIRNFPEVHMRGPDVFFSGTQRAIAEEHGLFRLTGDPRSAEEDVCTYNQSDTAKQLLATCEKNGLFPAFMQSSLSGLRSVLETVSTMRNRLGAHGQGAQPIQIPAEVAAFVLHSTGANILFLAQLEKGLR